MWLFNEGLYLVLILSVAVFAEKTKIRWFVLLGWGKCPNVCCFDFLKLKNVLYLSQISPYKIQRLFSLKKKELDNGIVVVAGIPIAFIVPWVVCRVKLDDMLYVFDLFICFCSANAIFHSSVKKHSYTSETS
jgi:hypothetical protein